MKRKVAPYARRSVWYVVGAMGVVLVIGLILVGYEINHLRNEVNGMQSQLRGINYQLTYLRAGLTQLAQR